MPHPPVLLVHGIGSSFEHNWRATGWVDLLESEGRTVLPIHLPGHGPDASGSGHVGVDEAGTDGAASDAAARILAAAEGADGGGGIDAVGFSAGGQALLSAAARRPEAFRRIAVLGVGDPGSGDRDAAAHDIIAGLEADGEPAGDVPRIIRRLVASAGNDRFAVAAYLRSAGESLRLSDAARITVPALVVIGDRDFAGPADGLAAALPQGELVVLPGVDHFATPANFRCVQAVLDFLQR